MALPVVAIIGRPNVGKSSLLNALAGQMISIVEPTAGVTRDRLTTIIAKEEKYIEQYIVIDGARLTHPNHQFKGTWLVFIDYQIEEVKYYQLTEPNDTDEPEDVFDLASRNLPIIGFTRVEDLKKQFEVTLVEQKKAGREDFIQVHLKIKPNSFYKDDYVSIDFWIDKKLGLPAKIVAVKTEPEAPLGDIEEIRFLKPKVNKKINKKVFEFKIPRSFGEPEIIPLKKRANRAD